MKKYSNNCGKPISEVVVPTLSESMNLIERIRTEGKVFRVDFRKKTTGEMRTIVGRCGVQSKKSGGKAKYNFSKKGLISVWEFSGSGGYKTVAIDNIKAIKYGGVFYMLNTFMANGTYPPDAIDIQGRTSPAYTSPLLKD